jgi:nucleoside-diphosphate-sugar epimerase
MKALENTPEVVGGHVYFISQGDPVKMWGWIDEVLTAHHLPPVRKAISKGSASAIGAVMEVVAKALSLVGLRIKPLLTRFLVSEMSTHHYFNISRARQDLGYVPSCSIAEAMKKTFGENRKVA